ncbi:MAG TPA: choice-of-anchor P family protein, partial [Amycolatopsis sp.]|nr:choice-of-anchor P family protein [Amycolatopsis sp.]
MSRRTVAGGVGALTALLTAGVLLAPSAGATTPGDGVNSAFAISGSGLLKITPTPSVNDKDGFSQESLAVLTIPGSLGEVKVLNAQAGAGQAQASVASVKITLGPGKPLLTASAIEADCKDGKASSSLAKAKIGDVPLKVDVPPNTGVEVPGLASVMLNKQVKHSDGSVTVTAISVSVDGVQKLDIASATCAPADDNETPTSAPNPGGGSGSGDTALPSGKAPTPKPVKAHLDVTGCPGPHPRDGPPSRDGGPSPCGSVFGC